MAVLTAGCSLLVEPRRQQCQIDSDCQSRDPAVTDAVCIQQVLSAQSGLELSGRGVLASALAPQVIGHLPHA